MKTSTKVRYYAEWRNDNELTDLKRQAGKALKGMEAKSAEFMAQGGESFLSK